MEMGRWKGKESFHFYKMLWINENLNHSENVTDSLKKWKWKDGRKKNKNMEGIFPKVARTTKP